VKRKSWLFGLKRRTVVFVRPERRIHGYVPKLRTDDLQQKLANERESDSILIESLIHAPAQGW
jgi:hypothetical protein